jgi:hypothetical protein
MKKIIPLLLLLILFSPLYSQLERAGGGLAFSTGVDYNTIETGNPGLYGKAYIKLVKNFHLVPSVAAFNRYKRSTVTQSFTNYMFQGDVDFQYQFFREGPLRLVGFAGGNITYLVSKYEVFIGDPLYSDQSDFKPGINLGGAIEMYIDQNLDSVLAAKYIAGPWDQFVIQLSVIYHFVSRKRIGW